MISRSGDSPSVSEICAHVKHLGYATSKRMRLYGESQQRPISWERILAMAQRWLPQPRVLHSYPAVRFAASHPR
jgi:hypothetical protein